MTYFLDDIFFIWEHGEESQSGFIDQVNLFHTTIKFTAEYSKEESIFRPKIKLTDGKLKTDLFFKPIATHKFLDPTFSHPSHFKKEYPTAKL